MTVCKKHSESPVLIYTPCVGCELEHLKQQLADRDEQFRQVLQTYKTRWSRAKKEIERLRGVLQELAHGEAINHVDDYWEWSTRRAQQALDGDSE